MLGAAASAAAGGADIVAGAVDCRGRPEEEDLLARLEAAPRAPGRPSPPRAELDLDAVIERRPGIALVDELERPNGPGARHRRRWQDALELLDRGISVWATLRVSSIESVSDLVEGGKAEELVPDTFLDRADEIELVPVAPSELARRVAEGRARASPELPAEGGGAAFERRLALLEGLAARYAARAAGRRRARAGAGAAAGQTLGERILVAVGPSPSSAHLVRWARRSADALRADWIALHVDDGRRRPAGEEARLESNLALARKLGAETVVVPGDDIAEAVVGAARARACSLIVLGRSGLSRLGPLPRRPTVSDRIVREAGDIDVSVVQDASTPRADLTTAAARRFFAAPARQYALLALAFAAVTAAGALLSPAIGYRSIALLYLGAVVGLSFLAKPGPVAATAAISALALNFLFIPPRLTFSIGSPEDWVLFAAYFLVSSSTGSLVSRLRSSQALLAEREARAAFLFEAAQGLAECRGAREAAEEAARLVQARYRAEAAVLADGAAGGSAGLGPSESAAAAYAVERRSICGALSDTYPESRFRFVPAEARGRAVGAIGVVPPPGRVWTRGDDNLLSSLGRTLALTAERASAESRSRKAALELESDRLGRILLDSVSHELRTPLTTIVGSISALRDESLSVDPGSRRELLESALEASNRLGRVVEDLLSLSRIESGLLRLSRRAAYPADLARSAIEAAGPAARGRDIRVTLPGPELLARVDDVLVARLAANLLRNASSYSPPGAPVDFAVEARGGDLSIRVRDYGSGLPEGELESAFERFRRGSRRGPGGLGLGLAICRGIAEAHGGSITARNAPGGGLEVVATFPACVEEGVP